MESGFKVVATKERRRIYFTAIPHQWEKNKELYWPSRMLNFQRDLLRSDSESVPESSWETFPCIIKLKNIKSFSEALELEKKFENCVNTDAEEEIFETYKRKNKKNNIVDRNSLFKDCVAETSCNQVIVEESVTSNNIPLMFPQGSGQVVYPEVITDQQQPIIYEISNVPETNLVQEISQLRNEFKEFKTELVDFKSEFSSLRAELKNDYKKATVLFEKIVRKIDNLNNISYGSGSQFTPEVVEDHLAKFSFPLQTILEINQLEDEIRNNATFRSQLVAFLEKIGGTSGQSEATKVGYKISDVLFSSEVLTHYSWTGISKKKGKAEKQSFVSLKHILNIMFEVLSKCGSRHTKEKNDKILKDGILNNAKKRHERKCKLGDVRKDLVTAENESEEEKNEDQEEKRDATQETDIELD